MELKMPSRRHICQIINKHHGGGFKLYCFLHDGLCGTITLWVLKSEIRKGVSDSQDIKIRDPKDQVCSQSARNILGSSMAKAMVSSKPQRRASLALAASKRTLLHNARILVDFQHPLLNSALAASFNYHHQIQTQVLNFCSAHTCKLSKPASIALNLQKLHKGGFFLLDRALQCAKRHWEG